MMKKALMILYAIAIVVAVSAQEKTGNKAGRQEIMTYLSGINFIYRDELNNLAYIKGGAFMSNQYEGTDSLSINAPVKADVNPFFVSKYEVSNKEYREFVNYVKDSIAHVLLGQFKKHNSAVLVDMDKPIDWKSERLNPIMYTGVDKLFDKIEINPAKLVYRCNNGDLIQIYPDTLCWMEDGNTNEVMTEAYLSRPNYDNFPVVGINYRQALGYCEWKMNSWNAALAKSGEKTYSFTVRLPSAYEWEAAAEIYDDSLVEKIQIFDGQKPDNVLSGYNNAIPGINKGFRYNFGLIEDINGFYIKNLADDGAFFTAPCKSYPANKNGVYNMSGNVAEWTSDNGILVADTLKNLFIPYFKLANPLSPIGELSNKEIVNYFSKLQIVKGGSWISDPFYLQPGVDEYFKPESRQCYLGFRIVVTVN